MWEIREKKEKYFQRWKPSVAEVFGIVLVAFAIIFLIYQFLRG